jgi:hypothetical protein
MPACKDHPVVPPGLGPRPKRRRAPDSGLGTLGRLLGELLESRDRELEIRLRALEARVSSEDRDR